MDVLRAVPAIANAFRCQLAKAMASAVPPAASPTSAWAPVSASTPRLGRHYAASARPAMPRKSGASAFSDPRRSTRTARKRHHRRLREHHRRRVGRHSAPGSIAAARREFVDHRWEELLAQATATPKPMAEVGPGQIADGAEELEYDHGDAMLDSLMGGTSHLSSSPDPRPSRLGGRHSRFLRRVRERMEGHRLQLDQGRDGSGVTNGSKSKTEAAHQNPSQGQALPVSFGGLPSDHDVSLLLRSYRDLRAEKAGGRERLGLADALRHLFQTAEVPSVIFGQFTYSALLTCCHNPAEARRVLRMMEDQGVPVGEVAYAILVDIHSRVGDYQGALSVMEEMAAEGGLVPPLTAYTSLLAGCYRVVNSGMASQAAKADAAKVAWAKWREMRVVGHDPDVMAYGAMLRILAAQGRPERAISVLEEMDAMGVRPTTLCFTAALRSVARSHANALRFAGGYSKRNRRRERIVSHHGRMARSIVIKAEAAEVKQDAGFVSSLMLCAATAGDLATAKAIYLAHKVRRMKHIRTIGGPKHQHRFMGIGWDGDNDSKISVDSGEDFAGGDNLNPENSGSSQAIRSPVLAEKGTGARPRHQKRATWQNRVYGTDTRRLTALLKACASAMEPNGLGNLWFGRHNLGYCDEWSLRSLEIRPNPTYLDRRVPGMTNIDLIPPEMWEKDADRNVETMSKRLRREKFRGLEAVEEGMMKNVEELPEDLYQMVMREAGREKAVSMDHDNQSEKALLASTGEGAIAAAIDTIEGSSGGKFVYDAATGTIQSNSRSPVLSPDSFDVEENSEDVEDSDIVEDDEKMLMSALKREEPERFETISAGEGADADFIPCQNGNDHAVSELEVESHSESEYASDLIEDIDKELLAEIEAGDFESFFSALKAEVNGSNEDENVDEDEAKELFRLLRGPPQQNFQNNSLDAPSQCVVKHGEERADEVHDFGSLDHASFIQPDGSEETLERNSIENMFADYFDDMSTTKEEGSEDLSLIQRGPPESEVAALSQDKVPLQQRNMTLNRSEYPAQNVPLKNKLTTEDGNVLSSLSRKDEERELQAEDGWLKGDFVAASIKDPPLQMTRIEQIETELHETLPGLPRDRIEKLRCEFETTLADPSLLKLVPLLREVMPDYINLSWLKQNGIQNARQVMKKAETEDLLDIHILNNMLEVEASTGSLDRAIAFHEQEFSRNMINPNSYSDRIVFQMLVKSGRIYRALSFKEKIEGQGRYLDLVSYGALIEHLGNRNKLGSALLLLKECIAVHEAPPGERYLSKVRLISRKQGIEEDIGLKDMIGEDPLAWLRHGEEFQKHESSYKGRRDVNLPGNRILQI